MILINSLHLIACGPIPLTTAYKPTPNTQETELKNKILAKSISKSETQSPNHNPLQDEEDNKAPGSIKDSIFSNELKTKSANYSQPTPTVDTLLPDYITQLSPYFYADYIREHKDVISDNVNNTEIIDAELTLLLEKANQLYIDKRYPDVINLIEPYVIENDINIEQLSNILVNSYKIRAKYLISKAWLIDAEKLIGRAVNVQPNDKDLKRLLITISNFRKANNFYQTGIIALREGNKFSALKSFKRTVKLNPKHTMANDQVLTLSSTLSDSLHNKAVELYDEENIDEAIAHWKRAIKIKPAHTDAKNGLKRALKVQEKLNKH